jgi:hypothetical protein
MRYMLGDLAHLAQLKHNDTWAAGKFGDGSPVPLRGIVLNLTLINLLKLIQPACGALF